MLTDLDAGRVTAAQYTEQFVVGDKEETWKRVAFRVEIVIERLLTFLEDAQHRIEIDQPVVRHAARLDVRVFDCFAVNAVKVLVNSVKHLGFLGQLLTNVTADEDSLEIDPFALYMQPHLQYLHGGPQKHGPYI